MADAPPPAKERHSLTLEQRRALRRWANSQTVRPSHKSCIDWFQTQYNQTISQSTVSHSLSPKYARLDGDPQLSGSRLRFGNWPDVEKLVLLWHQQTVNSGRQPSNEELAEKAKSIFTQLPRYKDEQPPEFSPGWIHRFKKRYGLLIRRQRRHGTAPNPADDIPYLVDAIPRFMSVSADTSPTAIRDAVQRVVGVEPSVSTCALVRDEILRRLDNPNHHHHPPHPPPPVPPQQQQQQQPPNSHPVHGGANVPDGSHHDPAATATAAMYAAAAAAEDPEIVLQNALRALQQEEADAETEAAAVREERERAERGLPPLGAIAGQAYAQAAGGGMVATPARATPGAASAPNTTGARFTPGPPSAATPGVGPGGGGGGGGGDDMTLTPIPSSGPTSVTDRPMRCPFCVNQRMLRTIKEAIQHMSTHVVV